MKCIFRWILVFVMLLSCTLVGVANADEPIEIEFFQTTFSQAEIIDHIISDFTSIHPEIKVTQINLPGDEADTVLANRIQNGDVPDIFNYEVSQTLFDMVDMGILRDVSGTSYAGKIDPAVAEQCKYKDGMYILPMSVNFMGVFYNADMFAANGWTIPETEAEFWKLCDKIQSAGIIPIAAGDKTGSNLAHWVQDLIGVYCPDYVDDFYKVFNGEMTIADMTGIEDVADIVVKRTQYAQPDPVGYGTDEQIDLFVRQEAAMYPNGSWRMSKLNTREIPFTYEVFPFPGKTVEDTQVMSSIDFSLVVSENVSLEKKEAIDVFLDYFFGEGAKYFITTSNAPSAVIDVQPDTTAYARLLPYFETGAIFKMPSTCRWTDATYSDYTAALQNLVLTGDKELFYEEFNDALTEYGMPMIYLR